MATPANPLKAVDRVTAKFGGKDVIFAINRAELQGFEVAIGEPAQIRLNRLSSGRATIRDIREVLEYAAPPGYGRKIPTDHAQLMAIELARSFNTHKKRPKTFVSDVLTSNPPLRYAVLAQGTLAAALHGIPETASHFDEDEEADVG